MIDTRDALEIAPRRRAGGMDGIRRQLEDRDVKLATLQARRSRRTPGHRQSRHDALPARPGIAPTLQAALDDWAAVAPKLAERVPRRSSAVPRTPT